MQKEIPALLLGEKENRLRMIKAKCSELALFIIASLSVFAVLFIFYFIFSNSMTFLNLYNIKSFFTSVTWHPTREPAEFGALSILYGSLMVTIGASIVAVPLGVFAAIALSDILPFSIRQWVKPIIELLASVPSVAYGFFALVIFAPLLQDFGGSLLAAGVWLIGLPFAIIASIVFVSIIKNKCHLKKNASYIICAIIFSSFIVIVYYASNSANEVVINSGTNAFNVSIILGIMALPTIVSVSEDALQSSGTALRMGSYGLGATRAETMIKVVLPASISGITAGIILGIMRALGETMVVWMAAGNAAKIPEPFYNFFAPIRTMTATIAGEMGETARGTEHYSSLFLFAACLLIFCFFCNLISECIIKRNRRKMRGEH